MTTETTANDKDSAKTASAAKGRSKLFKILMIAGVVALAGGGGLTAAKIMGPPASATAAQNASEGENAVATAEEPAAKHGEKAEKPEKGKEAKGGEKAKPESSNGQYEYYDFEPIVVNLDEPRLARYVRCSVTLALDNSNKKGAKAAVELLDERKPELKNWLTVFMAGCSLEDVRGAKNLNRLQREIQEAFNQQLWPDQKPMIHHILFKDFAVQ